MKEKAEVVSHNPQLDICELCGHLLENNSHGIDQNDMYYDGENWKHKGVCTYCRVCRGLPVKPTGC